MDSDCASDRPCVTSSSRSFTVDYTEDARRPGRSPHEISSKQLISYFLHVIGSDDDVWKIYKYCTSRKKLFIVIESRNYFWSFEKNRRRICVQRSQDEKSVRERYRGKSRDCSENLRKLMEHSRGSQSVTIEDVVEWIVDENKWNKNYRITRLSSKDFANKLFKAITGALHRENSSHLQL